jgi:hypothetical protein
LTSDELREYAETPDRFALAPNGSSVTRFDDGRICIVQGTVWAAISGMRFAEDELDEVIALVHELVPAESHQVWWIGPNAEPKNIAELLKARGFVPSPDGPEVRAMVLTSPPPAPAGDIVVRRVETFEDFLASREVQWDAFEIREERRQAQREHLHTEFEDAMKHGVPVSFLALLDGKAAATGMAIPSDRGVFLVAGATAVWARGHGLYRALVSARWDFAVERGTPALVTEAIVTTSYPILQRLGFTEVCTVWRLQEKR